MARRFFTTLPENYVGAFYPQCKEGQPAIFGLIVAISDSDFDNPTRDSIVLFKPEGSTDLIERRLMAFEGSRDIICEITSQAECIDQFCCCAQKPIPECDTLAKARLYQSPPVHRGPSYKEGQRLVAFVRRTLEKLKQN